MVRINNIGHINKRCFKNRILSVFVLYTLPHTSVGRTESISNAFSVLNSPVINSREGGYRIGEQGKSHFIPTKMGVEHV